MTGESPSLWLSTEDIHQLPDLTVSNELLGHRERLDAALDRDGYLFFRDVLDRAALDRALATFVEELVSVGVIDESDPEGRHNGAELSALPATPVSGHMQSLFERAPWRDLVADEAIHATMRAVLGADPFWIPVLGYRIGKPGADPTAERLDYIHQDGFFNPGIPFLNCWIPLVEIPPELGGIVVAEGVHRLPSFHSLGEPPAYVIPPGSIPREALRRSDYRPGDLLVLHIDTPHSGITNTSTDRFRLSIDVRMVPATGDLPVIGPIVAVSDVQIAIRTEGGEIAELVVDDQTYCRSSTFTNGDRIAAADLVHEYSPGDNVIVATDCERATVIRPAAY